MLGFAPIGALPLGGAPITSNVYEVDANDIVSVLLGDVAAYVVLIDQSDALSVVLHDLLSPVAVSLARSDDLEAVVQDTLSIYGTVSTSDLLSMKLADTRSTLVSLDRSDIIRVTLPEVSEIYGQVAASDTLFPYLDDDIDIATLISVADAFNVRLDEYVAAARRLKPVSALVSIGSGEASVRIRPH